MHTCVQACARCSQPRKIFVACKCNCNFFLFSGTLGGIFSQILSGDDLVRERCIKFLTVKIKSLGHDIITKDAEELLISECKKVLQVMAISFWCISVGKFCVCVCMQLGRVLN